MALKMQKVLTLKGVDGVQRVNPFVAFYPYKDGLIIDSTGIN
jgi:hypothetical protein